MHSKIILSYKGTPFFEGIVPGPLEAIARSPSAMMESSSTKGGRSGACLLYTSGNTFSGDLTVREGSLKLDRNSTSSSGVLGAFNIADGSTRQGILLIALWTMMRPMDFSFFWVLETMLAF